MCGLRWSDVDFDAGTIAGRDDTRTLLEGEIEEEEAQSAAGKRGLPPSVRVRWDRSTLPLVWGR